MTEELLDLCIQENTQKSLKKLLVKRKQIVLKNYASSIVNVE